MSDQSIKSGSTTQKEITLLLSPKEFDQLIEALSYATQMAEQSQQENFSSDTVCRVLCEAESPEENPDGLTSLSPGFSAPANSNSVLSEKNVRFEEDGRCQSSEPSPGESMGWLILLHHLIKERSFINDLLSGSSTNTTKANASFSRRLF